MIAETISLDDIGNKHRTDKCSLGKVGWPAGAGHDYLRVYERFLDPIRYSAKKVLEIGVHAGNSIRMWEEYFENAEIFGLDILETAHASASARIHINLIDQGDEVAMKAFCEENGPFDFIIEDGSHFWAHQIANIKWLLPFVKSGGVYVVEDLHTSYAKSGYGVRGEQTGIEYVKKCAEQMISGGKMTGDGLEAIYEQVETMTVLRRAAAFFKR